MANKRLMIMLILIITLLSTVTYAKPFTDAFRGGLMQINDFFVNEQYKPYATTIDFFFFGLLFIAIYMMGARYAFKEVKKPEQLIVILLGLMTAFLLVLAGFSATIILPYMQWLLYTLLFILYFWLLKGIKNKFWRFILALLLTLLTIGLFQGLFDFLAAPDAEGFFKSFGGSFGSMQFPGSYTPGVPSYLQDLFGAPSVTTPSETGPVTATKTPKETTTQEKGGFSWSYVLIPLVAVLALGGGVLGYRKRGKLKDLLKRRKTTIVNEIENIIKQKTDKMIEIKQARDEKNRQIQSGENRIAIIDKLKDPSYSWEAVRSIEEEHPLKKLYDAELQLMTKLMELGNIEKNFRNKLKNWQERLAGENRIDITQQVAEFEVLIARKDTIKKMGILWLIEVCYNFEKREEVKRKELEDLLKEKNVQELIKDKFAKVHEDEKKLNQYNSIETAIIRILEQKIQVQISELEVLKNRLQSGQGTQTPAAPQGTQSVAPEEDTESYLPIRINKPSNNSSYYIGQYIEDLEAECVSRDVSLDYRINSGSIAYMHFIWYIKQGGKRIEIHVGRTGPKNLLSRPIPEDFIPGKAELEVVLYDANEKIQEASVKIGILLRKHGQAYAGIVERQRALLKKLNTYLTSVKNRLPSRSRKEVEEVAEESEEAAEDLQEIEKIGFARKNLNKLTGLSKRTTRRAKAIARWLRMRAKKKKAAAALEALDAQRVALEEKTLFGGELKEGLSAPPIAGPAAEEEALGRPPEEGEFPAFVEDVGGLELLSEPLPEGREPAQKTPIRRQTPEEEREKLGENFVNGIETGKVGIADSAIMELFNKHHIDSAQSAVLSFVSARVQRGNFDARLDERLEGAKKAYEGKPFGEFINNLIEIINELKEESKKK